VNLDAALWEIKNTEHSDTRANAFELLRKHGPLLVDWRARWNPEMGDYLFEPVTIRKLEQDDLPEQVVAYRYSPPAFAHGMFWASDKHIAVLHTLGRQRDDWRWHRLTMARDDPRLLAEFTFNNVHMEYLIDAATLDVQEL
jgi:hypothetical protein